jgi:hydroxymethylpyrimidine/phosphomethylpyrimidine kinase
MLGSADVVTRVALCLVALPPAVPVVLDPVLAASDGTPLLGPGGLERLAAELLPRATVITPNRAEAAALLGHAVDGEGAAEEAALALAARGPAVLVTGGDAAGDEVVDILAERGVISIFRAARLRTRSTHGTGCTLSAAIAVGLARGVALRDAVGEAIEFVRRAMDPGLELGRGRAPLDHGFRDDH